MHLSNDKMLHTDRIPFISLHTHTHIYILYKCFFIDKNFIDKKNLFNFKIFKDMHAEAFINSE